MEFTGERFLSQITNIKISYEHWHRYLYASNFVQNKTVLDIACGEGYGSNLLSKNAKEVVGVDISFQVIENAKKKYKTKNLSFVHGSASKIPIKDDSKFDVIVSFETIEHISEDDQISFLSEVKRLLRPGGIFIVSTPNKLIYSDIPNYKNEYHVKEFYYNEFEEFLKRYFKNTYFLGHHVRTISYISDADKYNEILEYNLELSGEGYLPRNKSKEDEFIVAICSDKEIKRPISSISFDPNDEISYHPKISQTLFYDIGNGFNGKDKLTKTERFNDKSHFILEYNLSDIKDIKKLRFDPCEDYCRIKINRVVLKLTDNSTIELNYFSNACNLDEGILNFDTIDPIIYFENVENENFITLIIELEYISIGIESVDFILRERKSEFDSINKKIQAIEGELIKSQIVGIKQEHAIEKLESLIKQKENLVAQQIELISQKNEINQQLHLVVEKKDSIIHQNELKLEQNSESIKEMQQLLLDYERTINENNLKLSQYESTVSQQKDLIVQEQSRGLRLEDQIKEKNDLLIHKETLIEENKELLRQKQDIILLYENQIKEKSELIIQKETNIEENKILLHKKQDIILLYEDQINSMDDLNNQLNINIKVINEHIAELEKELQNNGIHIKEIRNSLSFRIGWLITAPGRLIYNLFNKRTSSESNKMFWPQFLRIGIKKPLTVLKLINLKNLKTLNKALKRENTSVIIENYKKLISNQSLNNEISKKKNKPAILAFSQSYFNNDIDLVLEYQINLIKKSELFDEKYYFDLNPNIKEAGINAIEHYLLQGWIEGCDPGPNFSTNAYLELNPDIKQAKINPLIHYIEHGRSEGRLISFLKTELLTEIQEKANPFKELSIQPHSILFISHDARLAGAEMLLLHLLKWFAKHTAYQLKIICIEGGVLLEQFKALGSTIVWKEFIIYNPKKLDRQKALINFCGKIDLIYGNTVVSPVIYNELIFLKVPIITHIHELEKSIKKYVDKSTVKKMHQFTDAYIGCSTPVSKNLHKNHNVDTKQLTTIHAFVDSFSYDDSISKSAIRKKLGLIDDGFIVFGCGTIYWRKGVDLFIETAIEIKKNGYSNFHFYWIGELYWDSGHKFGEFPSWKELEKRIIDEEIETNITFLGVKEKPRDYFLAGDVFFLSAREDPFPLVCLEAAQCKMPIICFNDAGGMPDFVENDAGFVVPFEDIKAAANKIELLIDNTKELNIIGQRAKEKINERHTVDIAAPQILEYCRKNANFNPLISVILPNYNYEKYLEKRLESIFNQTFKDFEVIILDDASSDNSFDIINKYSHLPEVNIIINKQNSGSVFKQWDKGIKQAKGEIIWIAEADDFCHPEFLEKLLPKFADKEVVLAYANSHIIDENEVITGDYSSYYESTDVNHWKTSYIVSAEDEINFGLGVKNTIPNVSGVLFRKDSLINKISSITSDYILSGDWFTYIQVIKNHKIAYCAEKLNFHRKHKHTVTKQAHQEDQKQIILNEAARIHEIVISDFNIDFDFVNKWDRYISEQINGLYFPTPKKKEYDNLYPYSKNKLKIEKKAVKRETKINKTAIIVTHVANKTGAPLTILNMTRHLFEIDNIRCITFALEGGELLDDFKKYGEAWIVSNNMIQGKNISVSKYLQNKQEVPSFALIQTACCGDILPELKKCNTKIVTFIHDYTYAFGKPYLKNMYNLTDQIIYSVAFMQNKNIHDFPFDLNKTAIIPQGLYNNDILTCDAKKLNKELRTKLNIPDDAFVVLGIGFIHPRKGIDIFIDTAIQTISLATNKDVHFVWLGDELNSDSPDMYVRFLARDIINSNNEDRIHFVRQDIKLAAYYSMADLFFLSSREDPFPTVVLEALAAGVPVIGIEGSSGSIEIIKKCKNFTVPYRNRGGIPEFILNLINNNEQLSIASQNGKEMMLTDFNFDDYVVNVKRLLIEKLNIDSRIFNKL